MENLGYRPSEEDIEQLLRNFCFAVGNTDGKSFEQMANDILPKLDLNLIEKSALMSNELDEQTNNANVEITRQLLGMGILDSGKISCLKSDTLAMKTTLEKSGYFVGQRDPQVKADFIGAYMINDPQDTDGFAIVGNDFAELVAGAFEHLGLSFEGAEAVPSKMTKGQEKIIAKAIFELLVAYNVIKNDAAAAVTWPHLLMFLEDMRKMAASLSNPEVIKCPRCSATSHISVIGDWYTTSLEDRDNKATLKEHQCHSDVCKGRSFWL